MECESVIASIINLTACFADIPISSIKLDFFHVKSVT